MSITELSRRLRRNQTTAEKIVWEKVRDRRFMNLKFRRQVAFQIDLLSSRKTRFIVDFYCCSLKLAIEIDGGIHAFQKAYDLYRDSVFESFGVRVLRFTNEEIIKDGGSFERRVFEVLKKSLPHP
ncbi:MAG: DUF559 domain-containing protein [Saprospiraceae bacterium]|nr:DUF559 domain-containing protein [Saprospiraceae bacterium]